MSLGESIPPYVPHAISVSLPTWRDNVGYEEGEKRVIDAMRNGYPRFFVHLSIVKLADKLARRFGSEAERAFLFPSAKVAARCREFMISQGAKHHVHIVQFSVEHPTDPSAEIITLHVVLFQADEYPLAKAFWQHAGLNISSRLADAVLARMEGSSNSSPPTLAVTSKPSSRYSVKKPIAVTNGYDDEVEPSLHSTWIEERYGRNMPASAAENAKRALRRRIAGVLMLDRTSIDDPDVQDLLVTATSNDLLPSIRASGATEEDVFILPTGMSAIWTAHQATMATRPAGKAICFGFPYTDTLKILQKWGTGCHFFGNGLDSDIDELEALLESELKANSDIPPASALFCEFPSNPLLRSADLKRLRHLADKFNFLIVIDETIGNFANVEVLPYADIVCSSLTKIFSGAVNVMGGSLVINPTSRHYEALKGYMRDHFEDLYFSEDAIYMESNSRSFVRRAHTTNINTEAVCDMLRSPQNAHLIKEVYYPKWQTRTNYDACRLREPLVPEWPTGFGGLFSVTFHSKEASHAFFDALPCSKGPSLGTNFTLACPYTILAHYFELDWAAQYGVEADLVRVSIGLEPVEKLFEFFKVALAAAEAAVRETAST